MQVQIQAYETTEHYRQLAANATDSSTFAFKKTYH